MEQCLLGLLGLLAMLGLLGLSHSTPPTVPPPTHEQRRHSWDTNEKNIDEQCLLTLFRVETLGRIVSHIFCSRRAVYAFAF